MDYQHLSTLLWREQELLDLLLFKAEEKQYLILTGKTRWLARIAHEIEVVLDQLRTLEVERAAATEAHRRAARHRRQPLAAPAGGEGARPVGGPARQAPRGAAGPRHRAAQPVRANRELIEGGLSAIGEALLTVRTPSAGTYSPARPPDRQRLPPGDGGRRAVSTFSGLNTAETALWAAQRAMDVTGQNVANANTDGYSRQRVDLQSVGGSAVPAIWSTGHAGRRQGVNADQVTRIRDAFLEARAQGSHSAVASLTVQDGALTAVQQAFREPGSNGLQAQLSSFWAGLGDIANNPTDAGARSQLLERAQTLAAGIRSTNGALDQQWGQTRDSLQALLTDVNATAASIAGLNQKIKAATQTGLSTNELADKRDQLVMQLSEQIGASSVDMGDGTLNVVVGGTTLVAGGTALGMELTGPTDSRGTASAPLVIQTRPGGTPLRVGGTADGDLTSMTSIIPGYQKQLDGIAQQVATQVNTAHQSGYDQDGNAGAQVLHRRCGGRPAVTAANLTVALTSTGRWPPPRSTRRRPAARCSRTAPGARSPRTATWPTRSSSSAWSAPAPTPPTTA